MRIAHIPSCSSCAHALAIATYTQIHLIATYQLHITYIQHLTLAYHIEDLTICTLAKVLPFILPFMLPFCYPKTLRET